MILEFEKLNFFVRLAILSNLEADTILCPEKKISTHFFLNLCLLVTYYSTKVMQKSNLLR